MASEMKLNASLVYEDAFGVQLKSEVVDRVQNVTTKRPVKLVQNIGITEEAIDLGDTGTPVYAFFKNLDPTNFINLKVATGGAIFAKLRPDTNSDGRGGFAMLELGSGATAPFAISDTATCNMEITLCPL